MTSASQSSGPDTPRFMPLPGMAGIALYMLVLSAVLTFGVIGRHYPPFVLLFAAFAAVASFALLRQRRWGWAMTLAATFLLASYQFYLAFVQKQYAAGVVGGLNLIFFLYLVRPEVREHLR